MLWWFQRERDDSQPKVAGNIFKTVCRWRRLSMAFIWIKKQATSTATTVGFHRRRPVFGPHWEGHPSLAHRHWLRESLRGGDLWVLGSPYFFFFFFLNKYFYTRSFQHKHVWNTFFFPFFSLTSNIWQFIFPFDGRFFCSTHKGSSTRSLWRKWRRLQKSSTSKQMIPGATYALIKLGNAFWVNDFIWKPPAQPEQFVGVTV